GISSACTGAAPPKKRDKQRLINAQDAARMNPKFQNKGGITHCNQATCAVVQAVGGPMGPLTDKKGNPVLANQQAQNLAKSNEYRKVTPEEAQQIANDGGLVIAAYENPSGGFGDVETVRPKSGPGDKPPRGGGAVTTRREGGGRWSKTSVGLSKLRPGTMRSQKTKRYFTTHRGGIKP